MFGIVTILTCQLNTHSLQPPNTTKKITFAKYNLQYFYNTSTNKMFSIWNNYLKKCNKLKKNHLFIHEKKMYYSVDSNEYIS